MIGDPPSPFGVQLNVAFAEPLTGLFISGAFGVFAVVEKNTLALGRLAAVP
jgi:hypothetical protein